MKNKIKVRDIIFPLVIITALTFLHYYVDPHKHLYHNILRRLFYFPIIYAAFKLGFKGGLFFSLLATSFYIPFVIHWCCISPEQKWDAFMEMIIYNLVAIAVGYLADREKKEKEKHKETSQQLEQSLKILNEQQNKLIQADRLRSLGEISLGVAHEIKNPLSSIKGALEIIKKELPPAFGKHEFFTIIEKEVERLNKLAKDFLNFARPPKITLLECNINDLLEETLKLLEQKLNENKITLNKDFQNEITCLADSQQLQQVFLNIILNAVSAMKNGGKLKIKTKLTENKCNIVFTDTGSGISAENIDKVFNPFFTTKQDGTGLGLSIAYKIIEEHQGNISVESSSAGTTFKISLPLK